MADAVLHLKDAVVSYGGKPVLAGIDFQVCRGETVALMGRSGAGKSTLLSLLYDQRAADIALVPQAAALVKPLSVFHNVFMGRLDRNSTWHNLRTLIWPAADDVTGVERVLDEVDLTDKIRATAGTLSGGQQQRVSVARALYNGRPVLLADEPVSALDRVQGSAILKLLRQRHETLVLVLHDIPLALEHADRIVVLDAGRKVLDQPASAISAVELLAHFGGAP